jgi:SAM-dependent MidA family methyltransferase
MPTPLAALLREKIAAHGPLTVEDFTAACLYHPQYGYYTNGHNFLPAPSNSTGPYPHDFTTAPELTHLFGATLANWVARTHQTLGDPTTFTLMECGPGRGTLMRDILNHLKTAHPNTFAAAHPLLIETSPTLTNLQQQILQQFPNCEWSIEPQSSLPTILIANELLDAFPHTQLIESEHRITPRVITLDETNTFTLTQTGPITELSPAMRLWLQSLPQTIAAALFLDYGAAVDGPTGDTWQAVHRHQKVSPFHLPGETDLTHHVNFTNVVSTLKDSHPHLEARPLEHLAPFLLNHGLASLALENSSADAPHSNTDTILHRLLSPTQMGTLFKVQEFIQPCSTPTRP